MADGGTVLDAVMKFARKSGIFETPSGPDDPITPALTTFSEKQYVEIWRELHFALEIDGIHTEILLSEMRDADTWRALSDLAFDRQLT